MGALNEYVQKFKGGKLERSLNTFLVITLSLKSLVSFGYASIIICSVLLMFFFLLVGVFNLIAIFCLLFIKRTTSEILFFSPSNKNVSVAAYICGKKQSEFTLSNLKYVFSNILRAEKLNFESE